MRPPFEKDNNVCWLFSDFSVLSAHLTDSNTSNLLWGNVKYGLKGHLATAGLGAHGGYLSIKVDDRHSFQGNGQTRRLVSLFLMSLAFLLGSVTPGGKEKIMGQNPGNKGGAN